MTAQQVQPPDRTELANIVAAAARQAAPGGAIIAFADSRYVEVLLNWLVALAALGIENYVVVALDEELHDFLRERRVPVALSPLSGDLSTLWIRRIQVFSALCSAGLDFVHSDVDAVWMRDPRQSYLNDARADLTISQGTVWPPDVHQQFGFVLCCGLFRLRSNERTRRLLAELEEHVLGTGDDQVSLNRLIAGRLTGWQTAPDDAYYIEGAGKRFLCSRSIIRGECSDGMRVDLLPHHLFQRVPSPTHDLPYVLHLLTRKEAAAKLQEFDRFGCLLLRPDWRRVDFDVDSLARLARVKGPSSGSQSR